MISMDAASLCQWGLANGQKLCFKLVVVVCAGFKHSSLTVNGPA